MTVLRESKELEAAKAQAVTDVASIDYERHPVLLGYREILDNVGATTEIASPLLLLQFVREQGRLPRVNTVVDAYNMVSIKTLMVVSAHDSDRVEGNPRIAMTDGTEVFHPLGGGSSVTLPAGQWAGIADDHVLCHLNCKQSELSKVTRQTQNLLIYVQGNPRISDAAVDDALRRVTEAIVLFNGGQVRYLGICPESDL
ncbi:MAG: phenylalanine--tRNA ligase beta subunit-related protein [Acidobacteriota bacterium]